jgi:hypothetical protein
VPAEQRLLREATVDCNALIARLRAKRTEQRQKAHRTVYRTCPVHHRTAERPHKSELQRSNPNGPLTWLAHRIVSGGAATAHFQRPFLVVGAINTQPPHIQWPPHKALVIRERVLLCSFELLRLDRFFSFSLL